MIAARSGASPSDALVRAILDSTGGNPLYIEEVVRALGPGLAPPSAVPSARPSISIPESLQPIFAQIVDRLGRDRQVAQMASLLGRDLPEPLTRTVIAGILGMPEDEVVASLARLVDKEIVEPLLTELSPGYRFRHELIREALAHSVGPDAKAEPRADRATGSSSPFRTTRANTRPCWPITSRAPNTTSAPPGAGSRQAAACRRGRARGGDRVVRAGCWSRCPASRGSPTRPRTRNWNWRSWRAAA